MRTENNKKCDPYQLVKSDAQDISLLLDGLIAQRRDLGELGKRIEYMLRLAGAKSLVDPKLSNRYH